MQLSIRVKMVVISVAILSLAIGLNTLVSSYIFQKEYSSALRAEILAIGQGLKLQLDRLLDLGIAVEDLVGFEQQCQELVTKNAKLSYALVESPQGELLFHSEPSQQDTSLRAFLKEQGEKYQEIIIPVQDAGPNTVATIRIGYPVQFVAQKTQRLLFYAAGIAAGFLILAIIALLAGLFVWITRPLEELSLSAIQLAIGDITCDVRERLAPDEIGSLSRAFTQLILYFRDMAQVATEITQGNLAQGIHPKSNDDILGHAFLQMLERLHQIADMMKQIAEGDLSAAIPVQSAKDVFGQAIHSMSEGLRSLVTQIKASSEQIVFTGTAIATLSSQDIAIVQDATASVEKMALTLGNMRQSVEEVSNNMDMLAASMTDTSSSTSQMAASIGQIASNTTSLTRQTFQTITILNETVRSLDQVVKNIDISRQLSHNTAEDALKGQEAVEQVIAGMEQIHHTVMTAVEAMTAFSQRSQDIDAILDVIQNITEQTSLLALNASIIAAQAGAHGRGFAVVADEIRNLSRGVEDSTRDIAKIVKSLQEDTTNVAQTIHAGAGHVKQGVQQTYQAREALQKIIESAQRSSAVVMTSAETLHELMQSSRRVTAAMEEVKQMTNEITTATNEQKMTTYQMHQAIAEIDRMAAHTHHAAAAQLQDVQQVLDAAAEVSMLMAQNFESSVQITQASKEFSSQAQLLLKEVDRFKLSDNGHRRFLKNFELEQITTHL